MIIRTGKKGWIFASHAALVQPFAPPVIVLIFMTKCRLQIPRRERDYVVGVPVNFLNLVG